MSQCKDNHLLPCWKQLLQLADLPSWLPSVRWELHLKRDNKTAFVKWVLVCRHALVQDAFGLFVLHHLACDAVIHNTIHTVTSKLVRSRFLVCRQDTLGFLGFITLPYLTFTCERGDNISSHRTLRPHGPSAQSQQT